VDAASLAARSDATTTTPIQRRRVIFSRTIGSIAPCPIYSILVADRELAGERLPLLRSRSARLFGLA
jgi:hypothetical protein